MPSVNPKTEKIPAAESSDSLRQAIVIIEHRIRNLEKRKSKLDTLKDSGKPLTREQIDAVSKYDGVMQQLELSKDYVKQFTLLCIETDKLRKKAAKKEVLDRTTAETNKIKQVLIVQDALQIMGAEQTREDFLSGQNGAITLTDADLKSLDDLFLEVNPKRDGPIPFAAQVQKAAENLMAIAEGRTREVAGSTGAKLQALISSISSCSYFNREPQVVADNGQQEPEQERELATEEAPAVSEETILALAQEVPAAAAQLPIPPSIPTANAIHILKSIVPVSQVESSMYNAQGFQAPPATATAPPAVPNAAPALNDVMSRVSGNFTFFQESELETTDLNTANPPPQGSTTLPTRTFTNQTYNGQPAPPPMAYANPPNNNPYYVAGYPPQVPPHYSQEMIQGYPVAGNGPMPAIQQQIPGNDTAPRAFSQTPQHIGTTYTPQNAPPPTIPASNLPQTFSMAQPNEEPTTTVSDERKEESRPEWQSGDQIGDWGSNQFDKWDDKGTEGKKSHRGPSTRGDRGDRPRSNFQGNRNRNNRDRDSTNNYFNNNQNGGYRSGEYQPRESRDYQTRGNDANGGSGYGGYRRGGGGAPRGPRPERPDRSQGNSAPRHSGPRPSRNNFRGPPPGQQTNA